MCKALAFSRAETGSSPVQIGEAGFISKMKAYVLVNTKGGEAKDVLEKIRGLGGVLEASAVYGNVDIVVKLEADNLADLVVDEIRKIKGVDNTNTLVVAI